MRILIIGASGLVGGNCLTEIKSVKDIKVLGTYYSFFVEDTVPFDTCNLENPHNFDIQSFSPSIIIHCGGLTNVDYCEDHTDESYKSNVLSTKNVIELCKKNNAKLVYISTDYIFDGNDGPYSEESSANPLNIYGQHKFTAEKLIKDANINYLITRITNVYGDEKRNKNFIASFIKKFLANSSGSEINLALDQFATPINASEVARAIIVLLKNNESGIFHLASSDYMNRCQLAYRILKYFPEIKVKIQPVQTDALHQTAKRPLKGGLKPIKFITKYPDFQFSTIDDYLKRLKHV